MAGLVLEHDWAATALGAPEAWSPSLRLAVDIVLASAFPMALRWGPDFVLICNDAYRPILGEKHPRALGLPGRIAWSEVWDQIDPVHAALVTRQTTSIFSDDLPMRIQRRCAEWDDAYCTVG